VRSKCERERERERERGSWLFRVHAYEEVHEKTGGNHRVMGNNKGINQTAPKILTVLASSIATAIPMCWAMPFSCPQGAAVMHRTVQCRLQFWCQYLFPLEGAQ